MPPYCSLNTYGGTITSYFRNFRWIALITAFLSLRFTILFNSTLKSAHKLFPELHRYTSTLTNRFNISLELEHEQFVIEWLLIIVQRLQWHSLNKVYEVHTKRPDILDAIAVFFSRQWAAKTVCTICTLGSSNKIGTIN